MPGCSNEQFEEIRKQAKNIADDIVSLPFSGLICTPELAGQLCLSIGASKSRVVVPTELDIMKSNPTIGNSRCHLYIVYI